MDNPSFSIEPGRKLTFGGSGDARVTAVRESLVTIDTKGKGIRKNEVGFILVGHERLMAEVLRIQGNTADMQVFEDHPGTQHQWLAPNGCMEIVYSHRTFLLMAKLKADWPE